MATTKKASVKKTKAAPDTKFDVRAEVSRVFYAGVGVNDLAVELVRDAVADVQKSIKEFELDPKELRERVTKLVNERLDALTKDAKARRDAVETRLAELRKELTGYPDRVETLIDENVDVVAGRYEDLIKRGESLVGRIRRQEATQTAVHDVKTAVAKAKTTRTQVEHAAKAELDEVRAEVKKDVAEVKAAVKKATTTRKATAKKATPAKKAAKAAESSAKATATATKHAAEDVVDAVREAAKKVGD